jgi:microcystin-dependent protein
MAFWKWSRTASSNATADNTINWAEGMAPSAVNDSARAMMARTAEWRDDISGTITTAGTSTAYTVTTNQGFDNFADMNGAMLAFVPHTTNGATVTLNIDGLGAKPLRYGPNLELQSGVLIQGTPYVASYNNTDGAFYLQGGFANPYGVPLGGMMDYIGSTAPSSAFVLPSGQAISRTTYATLFSLVGTTFGVGDGSTTFNIPDLRGRATFGLDNMGGSAANRITVAGGNFDGTVLGGAGGGQNQSLTQAQLPNIALAFAGTANQSATVGNASDVAHWNGVSNVGGGGGPGIAPNAGLMSSSAPTVTFTATGAVTAGGSTNLGSGNSHPILSPAMTVAKILRVI